ncbi:DcrB-related protein [Kalamiella sp. sgz302252]|uniref:DcrB-related protein n=1 Tax=Pantoea sp. sgz302252 TaxID=3341827 RepID=UPI0036D3CB89
MTQEYWLTEGKLRLPETTQDQSITILRLPQTRATLVVTRAWEIKPGEEENYLQQQLAKVRRDMKKFAAQAPQETLFGDLPAREVAMRFENQGVAVVQRLLIVKMPTHLLTLTFSRAGSLEADALLVWQEIKKGFIPAAGVEA